MKTTVMKNARLKTVLATVMILLALFSIFSLTVNAAAASDLPVTVDTQTVVLKDTDADGFYEIDSVDELYAFAAAVNGGNTAINAELTANIVVNNGVLNNDGSLNGDGSNFREWTPIGTQTTPFKGNFNGNNYTVSGLYFNNQNVSYIGLFGNVASNTANDNVIENVGVKDSYFSGNRFIGGVVGSNGATVTNCYNSASVISKNEYAGGVVGSNTGIVTDCYNDGAITGNNYVGGVVGANNGGVVTRAYNAGKVYGENAIGGVVAYNTGDVRVCYNIGAISGSVSNIGGVVGENEGNVESCYNIGSVFGYPPTVNITAIGGIVGVNEYGTVKACYYLDTCGAAGVGTAKSADEFESGEVTYLLNGATSYGALDWYQLIAIPGVAGEEIPQFTDNRYVVYYHSREAGTDYEYSNHDHDWKLEVVNGNQLKATCQNHSATDVCHWNNGNGGTLTLNVPAYNYKIYNGLKAEVSYSYSDWYFTEDTSMVIRYYACDAMDDSLAHNHTTALDSVPVNAGHYCAEITYTYDSVEYVLQNYYEIMRKAITSSDVSVSGDAIYDGNNHMPSIWVNIYGSLVKDVDYTLKFYRNGVEITDLNNGFIDAGTITVEVTGIGNYTGVVVKTYEIEKPNIENDNFYFYIDVNGLNFTYRYSDRYYSDKYGYIYRDLYLSAIYNGQEQKPAAFGYSNVAGQLPNGSWIYPVAGTDYTVKFCRINANGIMEETTDFTNVGEIYVVIEAMGNYEGKVTLVYDIDPAKIEKEDVDLSFGGTSFNGSDDNIEIIYNGSIQKPEITVTVDGKVLTFYEDYTYLFYRDGVMTSDFTSEGEITLVLRGVTNGNYDGWIEITYTIKQAKITDPDVAEPGEVIYNGSRQEPAIVVTVGGNTLVKGRDYTVKFYRDGIKTDNFTMVGEITVVIEGIDNYIGTVEKTYTIKKAEITDADVTVSADVVYNGQTQLPEITVTVGGNTLVKGRDYTVKFYRDGVELKDLKKDFINAGDITVKITGIDNYSGTVEKTFVIEKAEIKGEHVTVSPDTIYNQDAQKPQITVKVGKLTLKEGTDYIVSYKRGGIEIGDFTSAGTITVEITGIGNYTGTVTETYEIERGKITYNDVYVSDNVTYNGLEQAPRIQVYVDGLFLREGYDYTVSYYRNGVATTDFKNAGDITIVIEGINNYSGKVEKTYTIKKAQLSLGLTSPVTVVCPGNKIVLAVTSNSSELSAPGFNNVMFKGEMLGGDTKTLLITVSEDFIFGFQDEYLITIVVTYEETDNYFGNTASITLKVRDCGDCEEALSALEQALADLEAAMKNNDNVLANRISALDTALKNAIKALENADATNRGELINKIEKADKALADAIAAVQKNLDDAKAELNDAIANGDKALSDKIDALNKALAEAKALHGADVADLTAKIEAADKALADAIEAVQKNLDDAKNELNDAIANGDKALSDKIDALNKALAEAKALHAADVADLTAKIEAADKALADAIAEVQKNLDDAKNELNDAIANGDKALSDKIDALDKALADAIAALEAADAANKAELESKIESADKALADAIEAVQKNLDDAKDELNDAIANGDKALSDKIDALDKALEDAKAALDAADDDLAAQIKGAINAANAALEAAIKNVQQELDDAKAELNNAIVNGDKNLNNKIAALNRALESAKAALEAADAANKAELVSKIESADKALADAIAAVQKNLDDAKAELNDAIANGDKALSDKIDALDKALADAKAALEAADAANKAELVSKIETADKALEEAIAAVQKNLDDAKAELNNAIANGDKVLSDKIDALDKALADAKAALEAADAADKAELVSKIETADAALKAAIDALAAELEDLKNELTNTKNELTNTKNELNNSQATLEDKTEEMQKVATIFYVLTSVTFAGCAALAVWFIIDRKKRF